MDPIRSLCTKLRSVAVTLDRETQRLYLALEGEDSDFEDYAMRILNDLHSEVRTLKDNVNILLDKASLESQESTGFIKATKVLMKKNSADIMKIKEFFQKYGYSQCAKKNSDSDRDLYQYLIDPISTIDLPLKDGENRNKKGLGIEDANPIPTSVPYQIHSSIMYPGNYEGLWGKDEQEVVNSKPESIKDENLQKSDVKDDVSNNRDNSNVVPSSSVSEKIPCSPQLSDFGLERYLISQVPLNPLPAVNNQKEEPKMLTPSSKQSLVKVLKTPKCALNMDNFECVTPKLEHFGISEYTMCLNEDYTMELKNVKNKSEEVIKTEPMSSDSATFDVMNNQLEKNDAKCTKSPLAPTFSTPGLKIPSTESNTALVSTGYQISGTNSSSDDLEMKGCTSLILNSDKCFENCVASSSPVISSYENVLRTPTPPKVTTIPEDVLQILSKYNPNLAATPVAVKAMPPSKPFLNRCEGQNS